MASWNPKHVRWRPVLRQVASVDQPGFMVDAPIIDHSYGLTNQHVGGMSLSIPTGFGRAVASSSPLGDPCAAVKRGVLAWATARRCWGSAEMDEFCSMFGRIWRIPQAYLMVKSLKRWFSGGCHGKSLTDLMFAIGWSRSLWPWDRCVATRWSWRKKC